MKLPGFISILLLISTLMSGQNTIPDMEKAENLYYAGQFSESLSITEEIIQNDPKNHFAWRFKGDCHQKMDQIEASIKAYNASLKLREEPQAYINRGSAYLTQKKLEKAEEDLSKAIRLNDKLADAYYYRANTRYFNFELIKAIRDYDNAIALNPKYYEAYYMRAASKAERNDIAGAVEDYEKALALKPDLEVARINIAALMIQSDDMKGALKLMEEADPESIEDPAAFYFYMAEAKYFSGDEAGGCADYQKAMNFGDKESEEIYQQYCLKGKKKEKISIRKTTKVSF